MTDPCSRRAGMAPARGNAPRRGRHVGVLVDRRFGGQRSRRSSSSSPPATRPARRRAGHRAHRRQQPQLACPDPGPGGAAAGGARPRRRTPAARPHLRGAARPAPARGRGHGAPQQRAPGQPAPPRVDVMFASAARWAGHGRRGRPVRRARRRRRRLRPRGAGRRTGDGPGPGGRPVRLDAARRARRGPGRRDRPRPRRWAGWPRRSAQSLCTTCSAAVATPAPRQCRRVAGRPARRSGRRAGDGRTAMGDSDEPGFLSADEIRLTRLSCPECNGGLAEVDLTGLRYYRCHVGHQYGPQSLEAAQREAVEAKLWAAAAALEEHAALARHLAARSAGPATRSPSATGARPTGRPTRRDPCSEPRGPRARRAAPRSCGRRRAGRRGSPDAWPGIREARTRSFRNAGSCSGNARRCAGRAPRSCRGAGTPSGWRSRRPSPAPGRRPAGPGARAPGAPGAGTPVA